MLHLVRVAGGASRGLPSSLATWSPAPLVATLCDSRDAPEATEAAGGEWSSPWNLLQYSTIDDTGSVNCKLRTFEADLDVLAPEMPYADIFSINHRRVVILAPSADDLPMRISLRTCWPQGTSRLRVPASVSVDESRCDVVRPCLWLTALTRRCTALGHWLLTK